LQAGLGIMGGTSPYAGANIGQGAGQGVAAYLAGQKQSSADTRALQQGMLGLTRAELYDKMHTADLAQKKESKAESTKISALRQKASEREGLEKLAAGIESQIGKSIDAGGKLAALQSLNKSEAEILAERQRLINQTLMGNTTQGRRYQAIMKKLGYDVAETGGSSGVLTYDPSTKTLR
jgi:Trp operon repressor